MQNVLIAKNLSKVFDNFTAVDDLNLELKKGEVLGVLGPNGAGKTTTLQMLLGLMTPTTGEITVFGKSLTEHREKILNKVGFSSTYVRMPWNLKVWEVLTYTAMLYQMQKEYKQRLEELKVDFKLQNLWEQEINELSAGQVTRVNLAKAFINDPEILLLDEPTASLDPDVADYVRKFLLKKKKDDNLSIIITSHNMQEVQELCDRVIFINHGKVVANDTPENLARSINDVTIDLLFMKNLKLVQEVLAKFGKVEHAENWFSIKTKENKIADILNEVNKQGLHFEDIDIIKPSLHDYFLKLTRDNELEQD